MLESFLGQVESRLDPHVDPAGIEWTSWQKKPLALYRGDLPVLKGAVDRTVSETFAGRDLEKNVRETLAGEVIAVMSRSARSVGQILEPLLGQTTATVRTIAITALSTMDLPALAVWSGGAGKVEEFLRSKTADSSTQRVIRKVLVLVALIRLAQAMRNKDDATLRALGMSREDHQRMQRSVPLRADGPTPPGEVPDEMRSTVERARRIDYD